MGRTLKPPVGDELAKEPTGRRWRGEFRAIETWNALCHRLAHRPAVDREHARRFLFIPSNLQRFTANPGDYRATSEADPLLPDYRRDVQFTVNGLFQPEIKSKPGQTEIWVSPT
ncbi:MAG: hypothetical protein WDN31_19060 [Hyphomicrobium sp.]